MNKALKILAAAAAAGLVLLLAAAIALRLALPPEKARSFVLEQVSSRLGREVDVESISLGLFSGFSAEGFRISEAPDFEHGTFVSADRLAVRVRLLPLLIGKIAIREVSLARPVVEIVRFEDGRTYNVSSLGGVSTAAAAPGSAGTPPSTTEAGLQLLVSRASIDEGVVKFVDRSPPRRSFVADPVNVRVKGFSLTGPMSLSADAKVALGNTTVVINADADASLNGTINLRSLALTSGASAITASGTVENAFAAAVVDLKAELRDLAPDLVAAAAPLPEGVKFEGTVSGAARAGGGLHDLRLSGTVDLLKAAIAYRDVFAKPAGTPMTVGANGTYGPAGLKLSEVRLALARLELAGSPAELRSNVFPLEDLAALTPALRPYRLAGPARIDVKIAGTSSGVEPSGTLTFKNASLSYGAYALTKLAGPVRFDADSVSAPRLTGQLNGGILTLTANAKNLRTPMSLSGQVALDRFTAPHLEAEGLRATWNLTGVTAQLDRISGVAALDVGAGQVRDVPALVAQSTAAKVLLLPMGILQKVAKADIPGVRLPSFETISFRRITGDYGFRNGVMNVKRFDLEGADLDARTTGAVNLAEAQGVDLKVVVKLSAGSIRGTGGQILNDEQGRPTIPLRVAGTVGDPKPSLDTSAATKQTIKNIRERIGEDAGKAVDDLLKGLFKREPD